MKKRWLSVTSAEQLIICMKKIILILTLYPDKLQINEGYKCKTSLMHLKENIQCLCDLKVEK